MTSALAERQQLLETTTNQKQDALWEEVTRVMDEVRREHSNIMQEDMSRRKDELKASHQSHVKYVTNMLANTHSERRNLVACKGVMQVWREQVWAESRKRK